MLVYGRDGRLGPRLKHLFQGTFRNPESNKLTGVYEVVLKRAAIGSPGSFFLAAVKMPNFVSFSFRNDLFEGPQSSAKCLILTSKDGPRLEASLLESFENYLLALRSLKNNFYSALDKNSQNVVESLYAKLHSLKILGSFSLGQISVRCKTVLLFRNYLFLGECENLECL